MPITGKFVADFTDFDRGVKEAIPKLVSFQDAADKAGGRLMDLGQKGQGATPHIGGLASSMRTFDSALGAMGIHIGPEIKALGELGDVAGKSATALGLVATGGLALAVGIGAWKIGRAAMEFFELDGAIQKTWQSLLGFGDVGAAAAGAKADVLARASKNAGREITNMAEAIKINATAAADLSLKWGRSTDVAHDTMVAISGWQREIREVRKNGDLEQLTTDMDSQNFTLKELSVKYGIHVEALQYLTRQTKASSDVQKEANDARKKAADIVAAAEKEAIAFTATRWKQQLDIEVKILESTAKQTAGYLDLTNNGVLAEFEAQRKLTGSIESAVTAMDRLNAAQRALQATKIAGFSTAAREQVLMDEFGKALMDEAIAEEKARFAAQGVNTELAHTIPVANAAAASISNLADTFNNASGVIQVSSMEAAAALGDKMIKAAYAKAGIGQNTYMVSGLMPKPIQTFAAGGPVVQDGPIYAHAGEYVVPKGGGGGVTIYITQPLGTPSQIAAAIKQALASSYMSGGGKMPA